MRILRYVILAMCVGSALLLGSFIYPDQIQRAMDSLSESSPAESSPAEPGDYSIFFEFLSLGFVFGFTVLSRLGQNVEADKLEFKTVFTFISGALFVVSGTALYETSKLEAFIHIAIGIVFMLNLFVTYFRISKAK